MLLLLQLSGSRRRVLATTMLYIHLGSLILFPKRVPAASGPNEIVSCEESIRVPVNERNKT